MTTFGGWLANRANGEPSEPARPSNAHLDVEERTDYNEHYDYADESYTTSYAEPSAEDSEPDPIPVYIVQPAPLYEEDYDWTGSTHTVNATAAIQVLGKNRSRKNAVIRNLSSTDSVFLGRTALVHDYLAFTLPAGEDVTLTHNNEVWVIGESDGISVTVMSEFALEEDGSRYSPDGD